MPSAAHHRLLLGRCEGGFGLHLQLVAGWISDAPLRGTTASMAVSIEAATILVIAGIRHGLKVDPTSVRLVFTLWATTLLFFVSVVGFAFQTIEGYFSVIAKTQEFGVLKVLGASTKHFLLLLLFEALPICALGNVVAIALTFPIKWGIHFAFPNFLRLDVVCLSWPIAFGITLTASLVGGIIGARKAIRDGVVQALSYEA